MVAVSELVSGLDAELVRLGYKASTMVWYRGCWRRVERFFASGGVQEFSLDVAIRGPAKSGRPPRDTTAAICAPGSAAAHSAAPAPVLAPK